ncbi:MAG: hypothetical protein ABW196_09960 [Solirubrobacterales bacterium]
MLDDGPIASAQVEIRGPGGFAREIQLVAANQFEFEFLGATTLTASSAPGTYWVDRVTVVDAGGQMTSLGDSELDSGNFGYGRELEVYVGPDNTAPEITALTFSPTVVDTSGGPKTVKMTILATDDLSGVGTIGGGFELPNGSGYGFAVPRVRGTSPDGEWVYEISLPRHAAPGQWELDDLHLSDHAGNTTHYWERSELEADGFPLGFTQSGAGDLTPPQILGLTISPQVIHSSQGDSIAFDARLGDDLSGIDPGESCSLWLTYRSVAEPSYEKVATGLIWLSGDDSDGVLRAARIFEKDAPLGTYVVTSISTCDRAYNLTELSGPQLEAKGWDLSFENLP